jgi:hypothetical protein
MLLGSRALPVRKADNLTAICEKTVNTMWDPQLPSLHFFLSKEQKISTKFNNSLSK